jgi:hypothetical protein
MLIVKKAGDCAPCQSPYLANGHCAVLAKRQDAEFAFLGLPNRCGRH